MFAVTLLKEGAATWWQYMDLAIHGGSRSPILTWEDFKLALLSEFQNLDVEKQARDKLDRLTQQGPVHEYVRRVRDLALQIKNLSSADLLHKFIRGLKPAVQNEVELKDPQTWEEAVKMAERADAVFYRVSKGKDKFTKHKESMKVQTITSKEEKRSCFYCKKKGHLIKDCPSLKDKRQ